MVVFSIEEDMNILETGGIKGHANTKLPHRSRLVDY